MKKKTKRLMAKHLKVTGRALKIISRMAVHPGYECEESDDGEPDKMFH